MKFLFGLIMGSFSCILGYTATPIAPAVVLETGINADQMQKVYQLLDITGVQCEKTLPSIVEATQKAWLRPAGKERWEMEEKLDLATQAKIVDICSQMGLFSEVYPQKRHYHYCLIKSDA